MSGPSEQIDSFKPCQALPVANLRNGGGDNTDSAVNVLDDEFGIVAPGA